MNTKSLRVSVLLPAAVTVMVASPFALTTGCHTPPERKAFSVAVGSRLGVDAALTEFKAMVRAGKVRTDDFAKAKKALAAYKEADAAYLDGLAEAVKLAANTNAVPGAPINTALLKAATQAAYRALYNVMSIYVPKMDPNPPNQ